MTRRVLLLICAVFTIAGSILICTCNAHTQTGPQSNYGEPWQLLGLHIIEVKQIQSDHGTAVLLSFDEPSSVRLRQFTSQVVGRRIVFFANGKKIANLTLREAITEGKAQLTGKLDQSVLRTLSASPGPVIDLKAE
ncbi:MAG: hypothetical protein WB764_23545 [Xanthobacteraceae bacterium]